MKAPPTGTSRLLRDLRSLNVVVFHPDDTDGQRALTAALVADGHRRVGFLTLPEGLVARGLRLIGYRRALEDAGIAYDPVLVADADREGAPEARATLQSAIDAMLALEAPPTVLCCGNDRMAVAVYGILQPETGALRFVPQLGAVPQPVLAVDLCSQCGDCVPRCPQDAIRVRAPEGVALSVEGQSPWCLRRRVGPDFAHRAIKLLGTAEDRLLQLPTGPGMLDYIRRSQPPGDAPPRHEFPTKERLQTLPRAPPTLHRRRDEA